ncbi:MAG: hypothetical protein ACE5FU_12275, partial [Nitrospinota bacterium]
MIRNVFFIYCVLSAFFLHSIAFGETGKEILEKAIENYHFVRLNKAIFQSQKAVNFLKNKKDRAKAYFYMAASYIALGKEQKGAAAFQKALRTAPDEAPDPSEFSPTVLSVFEKAKKRLRGTLFVNVNKRGTEIFLNGKSYGRSKTENDKIHITSLKTGK